MSTANAEPGEHMQHIWTSLLEYPPVDVDWKATTFYWSTCEGGLHGDSCVLNVTVGEQRGNWVNKKFQF